MARIALRAYNREIEGLIEQGHRIDEAVAHCLHILRTYPKHLETYRLLGKAYLEAKRYDQAVDIFQRVIVAVPEDFVSHVGMSIIADDHGDLDEAIWHMERAFEVQPSNAAIQAELQRLFGRRDGVEPPKIRLTRGALAHMYVQGELYTQAISEIRAVLAHDQNRTDMQVLLARAYARSGQKAEATQACSSLLSVSPYCLDANRLMAETLAAGAESDTSREYRRRVIELDPYAEFAQGSLFDALSVPEGAVTLQKLEYGGKADEVTPDLSMGLDAALGSPAPPESRPAWLESSPQVAEEPAGVEPQAEGSGTPSMLDDAGWSAPVSAADEPEEGIADAEAPATVGNLPEWVRALAPDEEAERQARSEAQTVHSTDWLKDSPEDVNLGGGTVQPTADVDTPGWLRDLAVGADETPVDDVVVPEAWSHQEPRSSHEKSASPTEDDGLGWLEGLAEKHGAKPEELITPRDARPSTPPDWAQGTAGESSAPSRGLPAPTPEAQAPLAPAGSRAESGPPAEDTNTFGWIAGLADQSTFEGMQGADETDQAPLMEGRALSARFPGEDQLPPIAEGPAEPGTDLQSGGNTSRDRESALDLPDWLADLDRRQADSEQQHGAVHEAQELPDWLRVPDEAGTPVPKPAREEWRPAQRPQAAKVEETLHAEAPQTAEVSSPRDTVEVEPDGAALGRIGEPLPPSRPRQVAGQVTIPVPSLNNAKSELGRGNIAAALDEYARLIRRGRSLEEIIRDLRDALYRYPVEVPIWQTLGDAYMRANRLQEALDAYTKAEELLR